VPESISLRHKVRGERDKDDDSHWSDWRWQYNRGRTRRAARAIAGVEIAALYGPNAEKTVRGPLPTAWRQAISGLSSVSWRIARWIWWRSEAPSGMHEPTELRRRSRGCGGRSAACTLLTEKPIEISTARADALIEAAERSGVKLGVMFQDRVKPGIRRLREWIREGRLENPCWWMHG